MEIAMITLLLGLFAIPLFPSHDDDDYSIDWVQDNE